MKTVNNPLKTNPLLRTTALVGGGFLVLLILFATC